MRYASHVADLVGATPLVRLTSVTGATADRPAIRATVLAKLEYFNPGGSAKDRIARSIVDAAERDGLLLPGGTIVEATSGNTGVGLALIALQRGYRMVFVVPDKFDGPKVATLRAFGAEVVVTPTSVPPEHPESYYSVAARLAREIPGAFNPNQFANQNGPLGHYRSTGPEIWDDTDGRVTHFVAGIGTGGTISGTGRYLKEVSKGRVRVIGADPEGSLYSGGPVHSYLVEGVGEDFLPDTFDGAVVDGYERVSDAESFAMTRRLAREEGLLVGGSSGMAVVAALRIAEGLGEHDVVVVLLPDHGRGYLDKLYDDDWMTGHGFAVTAAETAHAPIDPPGGAMPAADARQTNEPNHAGGSEMTIETDKTATAAIHAGQAADPYTGAVIPPLHLSTTFVQDGIGGLRQGYEYGRSGNPTRDALQQQLAALEGGTHAYSFASGLAAEDTLLRAILQPGDHVLLGNDVYGGTFRLISRVLGTWGVTVQVVDMSDTEAVRAAVAAKAPRVLWVETPSNPLLRISDIAALAEIGHAAESVVVVDNTFATPALQRPLSLGADVVVHSTTKYLGGHSDVVGGAVVLKDAELAEKVGFLQFAVGAVSGPFDAWLTTRGIKTLPVRMRQHNANAEAVAEFLVTHPRVAHVYYPGLPEHPGHELAARQMSGFGGIVSVALESGEAARRFAESTRVFQLAESLGGVESLVNYPDAMTHASVRGTEAAVPVEVVRLSVGLEDIADLLADLEQALRA
ncbi:Cystathionine gamma-synthase [Microbacterium azadirachtae]|uniref:Cystathionine gamma-synthase n=2 Tax=Microbacterium azadirachtae TaxID=582680 RepID=A0A0F0KPE4_9MICO|nr:Cystathionine gamma-synthase [Microbacterium azadirachtae]